MADASATQAGSRSAKAIKEQWPVFAEEILARLDMGARAYGDQSLDADPQRLIVEIEQELMDVVGWGFILWLRLRSMSNALQCIPSVDIPTSEQTSMSDSPNANQSQEGAQ